ncbi:RecQ family ATP-dependent DNA helicase [Thalassoporum mexicanum]|uniref:RecQ family ATP-dependent DNA helicase n=1 Tax=Thalassoporum mexicanum TaxID=3457544 RepID=UPI0003004F28
MTDHSWQSINQKLKQIWDYDRLYPAQSQVIESMLQGRDTIAVMPTGSGKSLCFQLPALIQDGLTIVISPLIALMTEQVKDLQTRGIAAATINSSLSKNQRYQVLRNLPNLKLLYVSPETLLSAKIWQRLCKPDIHIANLIIDEAHCLVQWGSSFRPTYRRLGVVRAALAKYQPEQSKENRKITIAAFTATADRFTQAEIVKCLELNNPHVININPYRSNLSLNVAIAWTPLCRKQMALRFINQQRDQNGNLSAGLVYVRTRRGAELLTEWLLDNLCTDLTKLNQTASIAAYHAGLPPIERNQIEQNWLAGACPIVVCTSAFGLGINNQQMRWVLHFQPPLTLSEYVQEIGRAGRDGDPAAALLLISEPTGILDPSDRQLHNFFNQQQQNQQTQALALVQQIPPGGNYEQVSRKMAKDNRKQGDRLALGLAILHSMDKLVWHDPHHYELVETVHNSSTIINRDVELNHDLTRSHKDPWRSQRMVLPLVNRLQSMVVIIARRAINKVQNPDRDQSAQLDSYGRAIAQMQTYINDRGCRWRFILEAFSPGEDDLAPTSHSQVGELIAISNLNSVLMPKSSLPQLENGDLTHFKCGHCDRCRQDANLTARASKF